MISLENDVFVKVFLKKEYILEGYNMWLYLYQTIL